MYLSALDQMTNIGYNSLHPKVRIPGEFWRFAFMFAINSRTIPSLWWFAEHWSTFTELSVGCSLKSPSSECGRHSPSFLQAYAQGELVGPALTLTFYFSWKSKATDWENPAILKKICEWVMKWNLWMCDCAASPAQSAPHENPMWLKTKKQGKINVFDLIWFD